MKRRVIVTVLPALLILSIHSALGSPGWSVQNQPDQVYEAQGVDKKATFRNLSSVMKKLSDELDCSEGTIKLTLILHRTGKITEIDTKGSQNCKTTASALITLRKLKFTPAIKNGIKVSQYETFEINRELRASPQ